MRFKQCVVATGLVLASFAPAYAQRAEVSGIIGWTLADGVEGDARLAGDGNLYDRVDPKDSVNWGFIVGFNATDNFEVGFQFGQQLTTAEIGGTNTVELGDLTINTYHPYVAFNAAPPDATVRPYLMVGFGATNYGSVSFTGVGGQARETGSETQFSTTWGAGVKVFPCAERRRSLRHPVDPHLHQDRLGRLVVRSLLGLLRGGRRPVRQSVAVQRRPDAALLTPRVIRVVVRTAR